MFRTMLHMLQRERTILALRASVRRKDEAIMDLVDDKADILRRLDQTNKTYSALLRECAAPPADPVVDALRAVVDDLGYCEWATPEHAEEILQALIRQHHSRGQTALTMAGAK